MFFLVLFVYGLRGVYQIKTVHASQYLERVSIWNIPDFKSRYNGGSKSSVPFSISEQGDTYLEACDASTNEVVPSLVTNNLDQGLVTGQSSHVLSGGTTSSELMMPLGRKSSLLLDVFLKVCTYGGASMCL